MDPFTQGILGAALPQAAAGPKVQVRAAGALGFLAGLTADLDVFIRSATDPLAFLAYHRHFTHSLIFIPVGGLICALALHWLGRRRWGLNFRQTFLICTLGYATHAMLDAMTSYGTLLLWPFSDARIDFSVISIVDPLFTLPLAAFVAVAAWKKSSAYAWAGLGWAGAYLLIGMWQQSAALALAEKAAAERGHTIVRLEAKPSFANILIWKTIYQTSDRYYVDAARTGIAPRFFPGTSVPTLDVARDFPWLDATSQQARDIERFRYFSQGFVAQDPTEPNRVIDVRYSFIPNDISPMWSIALAPEGDATRYATYQEHSRNVRASLARLWRMMTE
jgi:inner membrane protein